jgi:hypothetical protein
MIAVDLNVYIALVISLALGIVLGVWVFYNSNRRAECHEEIVQCPVCLAVFSHIRQSSRLTRCPHCESLAELKPVYGDEQHV